MTDRTTLSSSGREVVGLFSGSDAFAAAVNDLIAAGFGRTDLSVLDSHESLDAAGKPGKPWKDVLAALVGELKYEGPLVAAGAILLAGGSTAALLAGVVGAAVGGIATKELLDEVTATPHTEDFARAVDAGALIVWVRVGGEEAERKASDILKRHGAANVHVHGE